MTNRKLLGGGLFKKLNPFPAEDRAKIRPERLLPPGNKKTTQRRNSAWEGEGRVRTRFAGDTVVTQQCFVETERLPVRTWLPAVKHSFSSSRQAALPGPGPYGIPWEERGGSLTFGPALVDRGLLPELLRQVVQPLQPPDLVQQPFLVAFLRLLQVAPAVVDVLGRDGGRRR